MSQELTVQAPKKKWRQDARTLTSSRVHAAVGAYGLAQWESPSASLEWESPSASLIEKDPEVVPDVDIAAHVGRDLFLDERIPRHESGQGYVRVVEHSVMWKETAVSKIFGYVERDGSL
jgi:hypothetical protein